MIIDNSTFNANIEGFNDDIISNLHCSEHIFKITNNYIKSINDKKLSFVEAEFGDDKIQFTISYDDFYMVPVFHFRLFDKQELAKPPPGKLATTNPHPLLNLDLWWWIHPCETLHTMNQFKLETPLQYLKLWFATYGISLLFPTITLRKYS